jgi:transposase-like protein
MKCPRCQSGNIIKNGSIHNGKQKYECKECGRQFVEHPENKIISSEIKIFIDRLLYEKIPSAGICRVTGVSGKWLQDYVNRKYGTVLRQVSVSDKKKAV